MAQSQLKVTILGCASSGGVPRVGGDWGACDPTNPKNRRRRCSILLEQTQIQSAEELDKKSSGKRVRFVPQPLGVSPQAMPSQSPNQNTLRVLIDTSPDLREQLLGANVGDIDAVAFTHEHADHCHGIDDLRVVAYNRQEQIQVYMAEPAWQKIGVRFGYCFETPEGSSYPPILKNTMIEPLKTFTVKGQGGNDMSLLPLHQEHGHISSLAFRTGNFAYSTDLHAMPEETAAQLEGLDVWIVDALRYTNHPSHFNVETALQWIDRLKPRRAILTNLHTDLDYETLKAELPRHVEPAYDGLCFEVRQR